jgi:carbon storage regulator
MLVLSRKEGESLMIGDQISVTILSVDPSGQVTLGISAPKEVLILRSELQKAVSVNRDASDPAPEALVDQLKSVLLHRQSPDHSDTDGKS